MTGAYTRKGARAEVQADLEKVFHYFPQLKEPPQRPGRIHFRRRAADDCHRPGIDGASLRDAARRAVDGPRPSAVGGDLRDRGAAQPARGSLILLAEQNTNVALRYAQYGYILETGRVVLDGDARTLAENEDVKEFYLGVSGEGRKKSFRDVKHYRRRKRWLA